MDQIQQLISQYINVWTSANSEKKSSRGRSSSNVEKIYGIQKLRELILDLAIQGRLIPGSSNEEPSIENPKDIANEIPFKIPKNWRWVYLPEIASYKVGKTPSTKNSSYWSVSPDGYSWVSIADLNDKGTVNRTSKNVTELAQKEVFKSNPTEAGSILMSFKLTIGKISILEMPAYHNEAIISIYPSKFINKDFLFKVLPSRASAGNSKSAIKGNTLNSESLAALLIPLPPLSEQLRIVSKVDELMALCDQLEQQHINSEEAHEKLVKVLLETLTQSKDAEEFKDSWQRITNHFDILFTTEDSVDQLKQALLQLAVMGKLVSQDPNDEPASELVKRIQASKTKLIAEGKLKQEKVIPQIADDEKLFELPEGWEWTTLKTVAVINPRNNAADEMLASFVPMTLIGNEFNEKHQDEKRIWKDIKQGFTHFAENDIGVAKITPCFENSKACVFENLENGLGAGTTELHVIRPIINTLNPRYVLAYLKTPRFLELGESKMTGTAGQKRLPKDFVEMNPFPLPPLHEQHRIVTKLNELMLLCDQLKILIQQASAKQKQIADVLVSQALH
jgi:type I restriction enzyme S subunit